MKLEPFWLDDAPRFSGGAGGPVEGRVDVAIVGGGFTGLSAALALARRGASVVVLESGRVAGEASGRNGGHCNNGLAGNFAAAVEKHGPERARQLYRAYDAAVDTVERIVAEEGIACDFRRGGKIRLAAKPGHYDMLARSHELLMQGTDTDVALVPRAEIAGEVGSDAFHGGLVQRRSAELHVGRFAAGLADAAARAGARIFEGAEVTALKRRQGTAHTVVTGRGTVDAGQVLLATGTSTHGPFSWLRRRIIPIGSFVIATEPLDRATLDAVMPTRRTATTTRVIGHYFRTTPDQRLIFGGRARFAASNPKSDARSGRILEANLRTMFPQLADAVISHCWGGMIDMTKDRLPRAGMRNDVYYAMGYSGHGVQMSVHMGQAMAEVMGGNPDANPLRDLEWPAIVGHFGKAWFLPLVGAWFRFKDRRS
ncbi:MAG: NAD(P)/FAD-dependent oxidoreductase [Alphaproteobacteria bacterium]